MRITILISIILGLASTLIGQEFKFNVTVNAPRTQTVDAKVFESLEKDIFNFYNNTKWTEDEFEAHEKIEGNVNITITDELNPTTFTMDVNVQSIRPVFNSNYKSQLLNYADKGIVVTYVEGQPIQNSFNSYIDPLSSVLTYYAYLILGYDYDSYEAFGGDAHFQTALNIINNVPSNVASGTAWDPNFRIITSRYNVIENLIDPRSRPLRQATYEYHLKSLDEMANDPGKSRAVMLSAITAVDQVNKAYLNSGLVQMFTDSKRKEIIEIFKGGDRGQQTKVFDLMVKLDPSRTSEYANIK